MLPVVHKKQSILQKVAKVFGFISLACAIGLGIYLAIEFETATEVFKASMSAAIFFFTMVFIVLSAISNTRLPDLSIKD